MDNRACFGGDGDGGNGFGGQKQMRTENYVRKANVAHTRENENESENGETWLPDGKI